MPSDIRNFFGGKAGGPAAGSSQEQDTLKQAVGALRFMPQGDLITYNYSYDCL